MMYRIVITDKMRGVWCNGMTGKLVESHGYVFGSDYVTLRFFGNPDTSRNGKTIMINKRHIVPLCLME